MAKLTDQDAAAIRAKAATEAVSYAQLAEEYGVSTRQIGRIVRNEAHVLLDAEEENLPNESALDAINALLAGRASCPMKSAPLPAAHAPSLRSWTAWRTTTVPPPRRLRAPSSSLMSYCELWTSTRAAYLSRTSSPKPDSPSSSDRPRRASSRPIAMKRPRQQVPRCGPLGVGIKLQGVRSLVEARRRRGSR